MKFLSWLLKIKAHDKSNKTSYIDDKKETISYDLYLEKLLREINNWKESMR